MLLAHTGHWLLSVVYAVPVVIVGIALLVTFIRERRAPEPPEEAAFEPDTPRPAPGA